MGPDPAAIDSQRWLPPQWASREHQERCESLIEALQDRFFRVRHFEMRRHPCAISRQAQAFLKIVEQCRRECPQGFVEKSGFTWRVVRHVRWLDENNTPRCPH